MKYIIQIAVVVMVIASCKGFCYANICFPGSWDNKNDTAISVDLIAANDSLIYVSVYKSGIYKSNDFGKNWVLINNIHNFKEDHTLLYVKDSIVVAYNINCLCFISFDFGENWFIDSYFAGKNIQSIFFLKLNDLLIASTNYGLFEKKLKDTDSKWSEVNDFKNKYCSVLEYYENTLYIATDKGIIYGDYVNKEWNVIKSIDNNIYSLVPLNDFVYITNDSGIFCYNKSNKVLKDITFNVEKADGGYDGVLRLNAAKGKIYLSSVNNGLMYLDEFRGKWIKCNIDNLSNNKSRSDWSVVGIKDYIFIGSQSLGIYRSYDGELFIPFNGNIPKVVY